MSDEKRLDFEEAQTSKDITALESFNTQVFTGHHEFEWTKANLNKSKKEGWTLFAAKYENNIVAVLFTKKDDLGLITKNTSIKLDYQGNGFSHQIKDFYEELAKKDKVKTIYNICPKDNFRMIALNEGHDYQQIEEKQLNIDDEFITWKKNL